MRSSTYEIEFNGRVTELEHVTPKDLAIREATSKRRFQEIPLLEEIRRRKIRGLYIDGGANVGNHTIFFARHTDAEFVLAFEAHPKIYEVLKRNLSRNRIRNALAYNKALWRETKKAWVGPIVPGNSGRTQLGGDGRPFAKRKDAEVEAISLDDEFPDLHSVGLIKLDVEDCEVQVVQGARELIKRSRPLLVAEHHNAELLEAFRQEVEPLGYELEDGRYDPRGETRIWSQR